MVAMRFPLIVFLSLLGLGVSRVSNQESAALAKNVYDPSSPLPEHMQGQWSAVATMHDSEIDYFAIVFKKAATNETVVAVRGTTSWKNVINDNLQIFLGNIPPMTEKLMEDLRQLSKKHQSLYLTGHSLGAAVVKSAFAQLTLSDDVWFDRIAGIVLFENPGIQEELVDELKKKLQARFEKFRSKITEFFGAPNPINMVASHIAATQVRIFIDHGSKVDFKHGLTCLLKSAGRTALWYTAGTYTAEYVGSSGTLMLGALGFTSQSADTDNIISNDKDSASPDMIPMALAMGNLATWTSQVGMLGTLLGLESSRFVQWILGQHSMTAIHDTFGREEDMPQVNKHIRMESWPSRVSLRSAAMRILMDAVPFHPSNHGIHTCHDPDGVLERRISMIQGYVPKENERLWSLLSSA